MSITTTISMLKDASGEDRVLANVCQCFLQVGQGLVNDGLATPKQVIEGVMMAVARVAEVTDLKLVTAELLNSWAADLRSGDELFPTVGGSA